MQYEATAELAPLTIARSVELRDQIRIGLEIVQHIYSHVSNNVRCTLFSAMCYVLVTQNISASFSSIS